MAVNYDVWGAPETWAAAVSPYDLCDTKIGSTGLRNLRQFWENGRLQLNTIDLSPMYYGIGKDSLLNKIYYIAPYISEGETQLSIEKLQDEDTDKSLIWSRTSPANNQTQYEWRWAEGRSTNVAANASAYSSTFVLEYNYQKMILVPYVKYHTTGTNSASTTLYSYITNQTYLTHPKIISIGYKARLGDGKGVDRTLTTGLCPIINVDVPGKNLRYNGVEWYSHTGMKILQNAVGESDIVQFRPNSDLFVNVPKNNTVGDSITALAYKYCTTGNIFTYLYDPEQPFFKINKTATSSDTEYWRVYPYIECTAENVNDVRDYILKQIAFLGSPFVYDPDKGIRGQIGDIGVYLPKFDNKGVTTGEYVEGADALTLPNSQWTDGRESGYDPDAGEGGDGDTGNLNNFPTYQNRYANANAVYALDESNFIKFVNDVNSMYTTDENDTRMKLDFKGSNPNDYVIGVYGIPFLCNYVVQSGGDVPINLGPVQLPTAQGKKVDTSTSLMRDCGTVTIPAKGNFLDYEPYTQIELYIPMCGTIQLDCAQVVGRTLHVIVHYDITTMACTGCVYRDAPNGETLIHTINGTIGASLPLTAARMGDYQNSVQTTKSALKQNEMRTALGVGSAVIGIAGATLAPETGGLSLALAGAAIGGIATAAGGAMTEKQLQYDLTHKQPALSQCSAADGMTAQLVSDLRPWIFIKRAKKLESYDAETYGKTVGFACCINSTVGAFSGFTVYSNVDLSGIPATKTEIDMIRAKLNSGIYI